ncbi:uncharacterized protein LOC131890446 [Tigriopus californicus]|nr:uncharacterized protein LOC131890446 [Tigriopus californicus]
MKRISVFGKVLILLNLCTYISAIPVEVNHSECPVWYEDYFNSLSFQQVRLVCHFLSRIKVHNDQQVMEPNHSLTTPTAEDVKEFFHVDNNWDMEQRRQELLQVERQEELLRIRDLKNAAILKILEAVSPKKQLIALPLTDQTRSRPRSQDAYAGPRDIVLEYKF